jgi:hypothetical protein
MSAAGLFVFVWSLVCFVIGYMRGWYIGVKETEERWSNSVAAEYHRKHRDAL